MTTFAEEFDQNFAEDWTMKEIKQHFKNWENPEKLKVPQFIADWLMSYDNIYDMLKDLDKLESESPIYQWVYRITHTGYMDYMATLYVYGYEVEPDKRYYVKEKVANSYLYLNVIGEYCWVGYDKTAFTISEIGDIANATLLNSEVIELIPAESVDK